ncbi:nucleoside diphosphate kinase B-like [Actinia tenebrosa]|uniref:Nucleoside diphosphate kinase n=1 Tax=Actinia tenebrosa TaxID=6105 RepID=A0A6P8I8H1_ACTTE|nr:nucleoside diphosphate kinase B-like [Actinia tenebrosa]
MGDKSERTLVMVKPDGVQRALVGEIIRRFEQKGFKLVGMKFKKQTEDHYKQQYKHLSSKPFYAGLCKFMSTGPVVAVVLEGQGVIKTIRSMMGETDPADSKAGTIRGDYSVSISRNVLHASDSLETAKREIPMWFDASEIFDWSGNAWVYE